MPMQTSHRAFRSPSVFAELTAGLAADHAHISPKYLYDALGSRLFESICELDEYYPTRTEAAIFAQHADAIARAVGQGATIIDLGAGNCAKAERLFPALRPAQYVPIDISADFLTEAVTRLHQRFPDIDMLPLGLDFSADLALPPRVRTDKRLFFYPGSSIGNFTPLEAAAFLRRAHAQCGDDGGLLIGVDLVKDAAVLNAAYDDALGVTAAFNLNILRNANRQAGTDFNPAQWKHVAFFNPTQSRIEMHLEAREALAVRWDGAVRRFMAGERIHTENSYKYTLDSAPALLRSAGFHPAQVWTDERQWFALIYARAGARA
ncbi:L-histidine N(alpha)-methyltransferase [Zemynaea arenosa]